ncbi:MAG: DNA (cytosine-5-)-methyltransferase [Candidatus Buchananbacteria bacterium CG10_big_fil_rev_8_21_14_0_10_42_9]|uniref:DNA (Cytosine-5-)-methyltransferase n=1 Tax=Candidatus Buchananbacteria bacterium CG10_big_fil_rev_8_21_14_0_10_42_9 TaxID=1974526 RepID=A0A2H0W2B2_9BACT|nr:MAG: DNA (cytosine-5-)-methyltransferase [Candidatus Buchananbacteria bacterium CG10_big_fil_rev_8_21_14_0_10_42_9]
MHITQILRKNQTPWEQRLRSQLRNRNINNLKFRRQFKIGPYVADFYCHDKKLVIECDGSQHLKNEEDKKRQQYLGANSYTVLRFWNNEIDDNIEGVVKTIIDNT